MHLQQINVEEFHRACNIPIGSSIAIRRPDLRKNLIEEECKELIEAIDNEDLIEAIDAMCDLQVVVLGTAVEWGIDLQPFWDEVHKTNMAKKDGPVREDGKQLKPEGWKPPDIEGILERSLD